MVASTTDASHTICLFVCLAICFSRIYSPSMDGWAAKVEFWAVLFILFCIRDGPGGVWWVYPGTITGIDFGLLDLRVDLDR